MTYKDHSIEAQHPLHIILPFDLQRDPSAFNPENRKYLYAIFPDVEVISFDKRFLRFYMNKLPSKPWPRTIAGVPAYFTSDPTNEGPIAPIKRASSSRTRLSDDIDCRYDPTKRRQLFELIQKHFLKVKIGIYEIQYWSNFVVIVLDSDDTDMTAVPRAVASCPCYYLFKSEMGRRRDAPVLATNESHGDIYDDSQYAVLRPGIMLSSGVDEESGQELLTTSGILVQDMNGDQSMTAASQGVPHGQKVFHPHQNGREIGEAIMELPYTDIALVRLHDNETFLNEFFENNHMLKPAPSLRGFIRSSEVASGSTVFMDSAFTGYEEGIVGCYSVTRIPTHDPHDPHGPATMEWIETRWDYFGQGSSQKYVDGAHGSVIWDGDGKILGFFRYAPASGHFVDWRHSLSVDHLIDKGFTVGEAMRR
ncbi:hypothetical protein FQN52_006885 [Onygenales sp. PD_12]|nr:hypothetical protein FQN52_006885 [Onygenales sp. PD_12]